MTRLRIVKAALVGGWVLVGILLLAPGSSSQSAEPANKAQAPPSQAAAGPQPSKPEDFVGSETCQACHEDQHRNFSGTAHAKIERDPSWKNKAHGCESCHGAGRAHVEAGGDKSLIRTFKNESPKQISDTCLNCHAGRDEHNNYRRGEHWRNDVGCTDCHSSHPAPRGRQRAGSNTFVSESNADKAGFAEPKLLKMSEPQLCMSCHSETKHQFNMPFRHKVLEGAIRCSDCHNAHGGFEQKQARLATGADAACVKCHTDKQGPFTFEHAPVKTEGCAACHTPHGSANPRLLRTSSVAQLCLECHTVDHGVGALEPAGPAHNLAAQYRDCTACHLKVHGSHTSPVFMR